MGDMESRVDVELTTARSAVLRWRLGSSDHPIIILPCVKGKFVDMESRVDVEQTTERSAVLGWALGECWSSLGYFPLYVG